MTAEIAGLARQTPSNALSVNYRVVGAEWAWCWRFLSSNTIIAYGAVNDVGGHTLNVAVKASFAWGAG